MADWTNSDGLEVRFNGPEAGQTGAGVETDGAVKELILDISDMSTNITAAADGHEAFIPAGSIIVQAFLKVTTAMAGSSGTLTVGLAQKDGTVIDADGILTSTLGTQANLAGTKGLLCDGALAAASSGVYTNVGTANAYVYTTKGGTVTAGAGKLVIRYI